MSGKWVVPGLLLWALFALPITAHAQSGLSRDQILEAARNVWTGRRHFEARTNETHPDQGEAGIEYRYTLDFTTDGHYRVQGFRTRRGEAEVPMTEYIGTPEREWKVQYFRVPPFALRELTIGPQPGEPGRYVGPMNLFLWTALPCGRPLHVLLEEGAEIREIGASGRYELTTRHNNQPVTMVLDPEHDWLPRSVVIGDQLATFEVLDYRQAENRWFPARVRSESNLARRDGQKVRDRSEMSLDQILVNHPIDPVRYSPPPLPRGAVIDDQIQGRRSINGTPEDARKHFQENGGEAPGLDLE